MAERVQGGGGEGVALAGREVLLMLSRAVQQATIYPPGHPAVAAATGPVSTALGRALDRVAHLTLAFTNEGVFVGTDARDLQPCEAPWLGHRLADRGVASLDFPSLPAAGDIERLIGWLAQADALAPGVAAPEFGTCHVGTFDYARAKFREARAREIRALPASVAWRTIANSLAGEWADESRNIPHEPAELARYIIGTLEAQEGAGVGELSGHLAQVNALFVGLSDEVKATVKGRLVDFVEALTPELRSRVLAASPHDDPGKLDLLGTLLDSLPRAHVLDVISQLRFERGGSTHQFLVLMLKITNVAAAEPAVATALTDHCRRAGMPLPPPELGNAQALRALQEMLTQRVDEAPEINPSDYQASLEALGADTLRRYRPRFSAGHLGDPQDIGALATHVGEIAAALLRAEVGAEADTAICVARVQQELPRLLEARRFDVLADAGDALAGVAGARPRGEGGRTQTELDFFASPAMVTEVLRLAEAPAADVAPEHVATLARVGGSAVAEALLARLGHRPERDASRRLGVLLAALDPPAVRAAAAGLCRRTAGLARDLVSVLASVDGSPATAEVGRLLLDDSSVDVRAGAYRLALADAGQGGEAIVSRGLQDGAPRVVEAVIESGDRHPALLAAPGFRHFLAAASPAALAPLQVRAVGLFDRRPSHATRALLVEALGKRGTRLDAGGRWVSRAICAALGRTGSSDATEAVAAWRRSPAGLLSRLLGDREGARA